MLVEETQLPVLITDSHGRIVDKDGNIVDLSRYGIAVSDVVVPETQLDETISEEDVDEDLTQDKFSNTAISPANIQSLCDAKYN